MIPKIYRNDSSEELLRGWVITECEQLRVSFILSVCESTMYIWVLRSKVSLLKYYTLRIVSNTIIFSHSHGRRHNCRTTLNSCVLYFFSDYLVCLILHYVHNTINIKKKNRGKKHLLKITATFLLINLENNFFFLNHELITESI